MKTPFVILVFVIFSIVSNAQTANFSGIWKLNKSLSDFGKMSANSAPVEITIKQEVKTIAITRKQFFATGDSTLYTERLPFSGDLTKTKISATNERTASLKLIENEKVLLINALSKNAEGAKQASSKSLWSLSIDGKTLKLENETEAKGTTFKTKYIYYK
ncbi:hypothetical protein ACXZ1K_02260 [Pedobacter sp. PWIIR3]